ncbi:aspartyl/asparaginyl beta-hydroxylase [Scytonema sp. HK-05]|uniref:aspartyl/asparaginyl beta-hydroxylase domain-containing protein n=1 Tax=Scytonema sp. HK-05 TaxID=1137095 RepID=UPI000936DD2F|nr:aspartyl/asparaginyl beta-hydroxylase domain-containing protein [Scytonema sp. HK-05]OKH55352.1 aspartyl beta-hydroxylase [Scytonema sp. HK-05]BAY42786.1 aspartyl/asparaginyl beta-hydroxylase [Scytonema sp. HK-05]
MKSFVSTLFKKLENFLLPKFSLLIPKYSLVGDSIFFETSQFPWAYELEANWKVIRKELDQVMQYTDALPNLDDIYPRSRHLAGDNMWKTYLFYSYGFKSKKNCEQCPETTKLLEKIPGMKLAFFSILAPGKHIPEHYSKIKGVIRYHLGLRVPEPQMNCRIRICDQTAYWEEGKSLIFDDTFPHEVWNDTDDYRVVLWLDIVRPLRFPLSLVNGLVLYLISVSPLFQGIKTNHEKWEEKFKALQK